MKAQVAGFLVILGSRHVKRGSIRRVQDLSSGLQMLKVTGLRFPFRIWSVHRVSAELGPMISRLNQLLVAELSRYSIPNR